MSSVDFTWLIGGPQGSGVESGANVFSKVCAELGYNVFGKREFYSNIKGEHSYFAVRVSDKKIHSNVDDVTLMASFDAETIFRHFDEVFFDEFGAFFRSLFAVLDAAFPFEHSPTIIAILGEF